MNNFVAFMIVRHVNDIDDIYFRHVDDIDDIYFRHVDDIDDIYFRHVDDIDDIYFRHVDDIDAFVGMVLETHLENAIVGPTLACILGHQFRDMKHGDRFFYTNKSSPEGFTSSKQLISSMFYSILNVLQQKSQNTINKC